MKTNKIIMNKNMFKKLFKAIEELKWKLRKMKTNLIKKSMII